MATAFMIIATHIEDVSPGEILIARIMSGIVYSRSVRLAGNAMDEAVTDYLKRKHSSWLASARLSKPRWKLVQPILWKSLARWK
jgi:actin-like ATPase involved in cell morphogenesis